MLNVRLYFPAPDGSAAHAATPETTASPEVDDALGAWRTAGATLWLDAEHPTAAEMAFLAEVFDLDALAPPAPLSASGPRPRIQHLGDYVRLQLYVPHPGSLSQPGRLTPLEDLSVLFGERILLTLHSEPMPMLGAAVTPSVRAQVTTWGVAGMLHALLEAVVDAYGVVLDHLIELAESHEATTYRETPVPDAATRPALLALGRIRRDLFLLRRITAAQRSALLLLARDSAMIPGTPDTAGAPLSFGDILDHAVRLEQAFAVQHDHLTNARAAYRSWVTTGVAGASKTLLLVTCLLSVPTLVVGVYGMNFVHFPELAWPIGVAWAGALILLLDGTLWLYFRRRGWL
jgi:magnesium transporter